MKFILALAATAALCAAPAVAQVVSKAPAKDAGAAASMDMSKMTPEQMHAHCAMMMGGKMQGAPKHDHNSDKLGHAPGTKKPSDAEMKAMHEKCAAVMSKKP